MENKQSYYDLLKIIDSLGSIEKVATNPNIINQIIAYDTDRHLLCALMDRINDAIEAGKLLPEELTFFRSGMLMDSIVNLKKTVENYGNTPNRELYTSEILDKVNYVSLLHDSESLAACYTHPEIIKAICGNGTVPNARDLTWWVNCGTFSSLPKDVQMTIICEVAKINPSAVTALLSEIQTLPTSTIKQEKENGLHM